MASGYLDAAPAWAASLLGSPAKGRSPSALPHFPFATKPLSRVLPPPEAGDRHHNGESWPVGVARLLGGGFGRGRHGRLGENLPELYRTGLVQPELLQPGSSIEITVIEYSTGNSYFPFSCFFESLLFEAEWLRSRFDRVLWMLSGSESG